MADSRASIPERVTRAEFLAEVRNCLDRPGPFLSGVVRSVDLQAVDLEIAVSPAQAGGSLTEAFERLRADVGDPPAGFVAFVIAGDGSTIWRLYDEEIEQSRLLVGSCPRVITLLEAEQRTAHHVVAVIEDASLELATFPRHGSPTLHRTESDSIDRTTHLVASAVVASDTRLVIVAASSDTAEEIRRRLRTEIPVETVIGVVDTDRWADDDDIADRVVAEVATLAASRTVELLRDLRFARAHGLVEADVVDTLRGVRSGTVTRLLITPEPDDERTAWFGADPRQIALDLEDAARALPDVELQQGPLLDVLVRSALLQGADVHITPVLPDDTLPGGIGVVLAEPPPADFG